MTKKEMKTEYQNMIEYQNTYNRLKMLTLNLFEWENLPESVDEDYLENTLHQYGFAIGFIDSHYGKLALAGSESGFVNIYGKATDYRVHGNNYEKLINQDELVVIKNNNMKLSTFSILQEFAMKIADVQRTIDVLLNTHKAPYMIVSEEKQVHSIRVALKKIKNNEDEVIADKGLGIESIKVLKTDAPFIIDKLWDYKRSLWGEAKAFIGIDSASIDKKERLVVDEANANNQEIDLNLEAMFDARKDSAKQLSKLWGVEVIVRLRKEFVENQNELGDDDYEEE